MVGSRNIKAHSFKVRVSSPRIMACIDPLKFKCPLKVLGLRILASFPRFTFQLSGPATHNAQHTTLHSERRFTTQVVTTRPGNRRAAEPRSRNATEHGVATTGVASGLPQRVIATTHAAGVATDAVAKPLSVSETCRRPQGERAAPAFSRPGPLVRHLEQGPG